MPAQVQPSHADLLAVGKIVGEVRVNGHPWEVATFARVSGYVEQVSIAQTDMPTRHLTAGTLGSDCCHCGAITNASHGAVLLWQMPYRKMHILLASPSVEPDTW